MKILVILVVLVLLAVGVRLAIPYLGNSVAGGIVERDGQQTLAACPDTPNCHRDEFNVTTEPSQAIKTLAELVSQQSGTKIVSQNEHYLHATFSSALMGFVDDVEFLLIADDAGTLGTQSSPRLDSQATVLVRSASRLGKSDLGANAKRVERLRSARRLSENSDRNEGVRF